MRIAKDDLKFIAFSQIGLEFSPKARRKALEIVEAAIRCCALHGWQHLTMAMIARETGVARPLINHYFKNIELLRVFTIKYVRYHFQLQAVAAIERESKHDLQLRRYVQACFSWARNSRLHALTWMSFLSSCSRSNKDRDLNTASVQVGTDRIEALISAAKWNSNLSARARARLIQSLIGGAIIADVTEEMPSAQEFRQSVEDQVLAIAGLLQA